MPLLSKVTEFRRAPFSDWLRAHEEQAVIKLKNKNSYFLNHLKLDARHLGIRATELVEMEESKVTWLEHVMGFSRVNYTTKGQAITPPNST